MVISMNSHRVVLLPRYNGRRLVVDTGLHAKGWSIEQSIEYMMQKTGMHYHEVEGEVHRYATWPGQATAYKIGQLGMEDMTCVGPIHSHCSS